MINPNDITANSLPWLDAEIAKAEAVAKTLEDDLYRASVALEASRKSNGNASETLERRWAGARECLHACNDRILDLCTARIASLEYKEMADAQE